MDKTLIVKLRGHHLDAMVSDFYHNESLRIDCRYDGRPFTETSWYIDQERLSEWYTRLIRENPYIALTDEPDSICAETCSWFIRNEGIADCGKMHYDSKISNLELDDLILRQKESDHRLIEEWGLKVGDTLRFSSLLQKMIDRSKEHFGCSKGCTETFEESLKKVLHPRLVELYLLD